MDNQGAGIRVVAAEDSYVVREFLSSALEQAPGLELVAVCSDRMELDRAIESSQPDVIVTDIRMPPSGEDEGIRVASRLRESHPEMGSWSSVNTPIQLTRWRCWSPGWAAR
jgi:DNA-binding NarL/FixJ family response regulator